MRKIRLDLCDFGPNTSKTDHYIYKLLNERFEVELCDQPDFLIYCGSCYQSHRLHSCVKIYYSVESDWPDFRACDYSVAPVQLDDPRHLQFPHYAIYDAPGALSKRHDRAEKILAAKTKFCSFVISNHNPGRNDNRVEFFRKLSQYKKVDSGGRKFNNIGGPIPGGPSGKIDFLRNYKFNIAFENRSLAGYATEKIIEPMLAGCLPIYWGDPTIHEQFNPRSFLNRADFASDEALIEKIIELDQDDAKYLEYLRQPHFHNDVPNLYFNRARTLDFFEKIFTKKITPVAQVGRKSFFGRVFGRWKIVKRHHWHPVQPPTW